MSTFILSSRSAEVTVRNSSVSFPTCFRIDNVGHSEKGGGRGVEWKFPFISFIIFDGLPKWDKLIHPTLTRLNMFSVFITVKPSVEGRVRTTEGVTSGLRELANYLVFSADNLILYLFKTPRISSRSLSASSATERVESELLKSLPRGTSPSSKLVNSSLFGVISWSKSAGSSED